MSRTKLALATPVKPEGICEAIKISWLHKLELADFEVDLLPEFRNGYDDKETWGMETRETIRQAGGLVLANMYSTTIKIDDTNRMQLMLAADEKKPAFVQSLDDDSTAISSLPLKPEIIEIGGNIHKIRQVLESNNGASQP